MKPIKSIILFGVSLFLALNSSLFIPSAHAQWYTGMSQKTGLALCIHLTDTSVELYSPMQLKDPLPECTWSQQHGKLTIECKKIGFKTELTLRDSIYSGYWKQGFLKEDITFFPTDTIFSLRRPQTPQQPYRFDEETVTADLTDSQGNKVHLEGTLSVPRGSASRYPCLILVSGSGQQNRDEEIMQHKPFLVLADYLASRGIAVLRYDDRGVGGSTGDAEHGTTALFSEDAEAMFNAVRSNPRIDPDRLGIGGHSEGGAIAPMVAARNNDVKFVVMLGGQGCTGLDVMLQQNDAIFRAAGIGDNLLAVRQACIRELFDLKNASQKEYKAVIARHTKGLTKEQVDSIGLGRGTAAAFKQQMDLPWMQAFLTLDPADYLPKVHCPILALNGGKDCQVLCEPNQKRIKELTGGRAVCHRLPDLNHLFQHCTTGSIEEYNLIEETFSEEAMAIIADWILAL